MFSLATVSLSFCSSAISSRIGAITLHGPHHSAQKSTRTGTSEALTCSSKVASSSCTIFSLIVIPLVCEPSGHRSWPGGRRTIQRPPCGGCSRSGALGLEVALGVDGGHAPRAGGGDRLAVVVVLQVPAGEDPLDARDRAPEGPDVAEVVELELALDDRRV